MSKALGIPYSQIIGLEGLQAYAIDGAVIHWGTAFQNAIDTAVNGAKNQTQAEQKASQVLRRWVPSTRVYR